MGEKHKKFYPYANLKKKNHRVERARYAFLGRSRTLCFRDVLQVTGLRMLTVRKLCFALVYGVLEAIPERKFSNSQSLEVKKVLSALKILLWVKFSVEMFSIIPWLIIFASACVRAMVQ